MNKIKIFKGGYDITEMDIIFNNVDIIGWVKSNHITNAFLNKGYLNYWTVVNEKDLKTIIKSNPQFNFRIVKFANGNYIICMDNVKILSINNVHIVDRKELLPLLDLNNHTVMAFDYNYNLLSIETVSDIEHPYYAKVNCIKFGDHSISLSQTIQNISSELNNNKLISILNDRMVWDKAVNYLLNSVNNEQSNISDIEWRHDLIKPDNSLLIFDSNSSLKDNLDNFEIVKTYQYKLSKYLNQFNLKINNIQRQYEYY